MVFRVFVEKKDEFAHEANSLKSEFCDLFNINGLDKIRIINRYDVEDIDQKTFEKAVKNVFSEPQVDNVYSQIDTKDSKYFAIEYLPGQFDQRADSAAQCIQIMCQGIRPNVKSAKLVLLYGDLSDADVLTIKKYMINPVESREASMELPKTLKMDYEIPVEIETVDGFLDMHGQDLETFLTQKGLAMDIDDLIFVQDYFKKLKRNPTITEIKVIDTYWSDHCRHTTFHTIIDNVTFEDELLQNAYNDYLKTRQDLNVNKPICLMDIATIATKFLKKNGKLEMQDESEEINACTVKINIEVDGKLEK